MARPAPDDDRRAVLRRLERHAAPGVSAPDRALTRNKTRPGLSLRLVIGVLIVVAVILLGIWEIGRASCRGRGESSASGGWREKEGDGRQSEETDGRRAREQCR